MSRQSVVYVIGVQDNPVKIGVASDVNSRLSGLQIGCPDELKIFYTHPVIRKAVHPLESAVHQHLLAHCRHGEWFNVSVAVAKQTIQRLAPAIEGGLKEDRRDLFQRIETEHPLPSGARDIVHRYQVAAKNQDLASKTRARRMEVRIASAGPVAANLFRAAFVDGKDYLDITAARNWRMARNIRIELARAITALCASVGAASLNAGLDSFPEKAA